MKRLLPLGSLLLTWASLGCLALAIILSPSVGFADEPVEQQAVGLPWACPNCFGCGQDPNNGNCIGGCLGVPGGPFCNPNCGCKKGLLGNCGCKQ